MPVTGPISFPTAPVAESTIETATRVTLAATLRGLPTITADPTCVVRGASALKALWTVDGAATVFLRQTGPTTVEAAGWGPGADTALRLVEGWTGAADDLESFDPSVHPVLDRIAGQRPPSRMGRFGGVFERIVPTVLGQKVIAKEAKRSYRRLVHLHGEPAPGWDDVRLPPHPHRLVELGTHGFHALGVERKRADTILRLARAGSRLDRLAARPAPDAYEHLRRFPGIGPWTVAKIGRSVFGDPDTVEVGDYNVPSLVTYALEGERHGTDSRMLELLEPFAGHRGRVVTLLKFAGVGPPRRGPRLRFRNVQDH